jgi:hypothetical protein
MSRATTEQKPSSSLYDEYTKSQLWIFVNEAITDLVDNDDIVEKMRRDYIVGYICKKLQGIADMQPNQGSN